MVGLKKSIALLMGDIVHSEASLTPEQQFRDFNAAIEHINAKGSSKLLSPLTITLGDEFQGFFDTLEPALNTARALRFDLKAKGIECRFVIGHAVLDSPVNERIAWNMMGRGLGRARQKLNEKQANTNYRFSLPDAPIIEGLLDGIGIGLTLIERGWTDTQFEIINALQGGLSAKDLAECRGVSVHNVYKVRSAGDYDSYIDLWRKAEYGLPDITQKAIE